MQHLVEKNLRARLLQHAPLAAQWATEKIVLEFFSDAQTLAMDWKLPMQFLHWLQAQPAYREEVNEAMIKDLLAATVVRWAMQGLDHITARGMLVVSCYSTLAAGLWKSNEVDSAHKIIFLRLDQQPTASCHAISYQHNSWQNAEWQLL